MSIRCDRVRADLTERPGGPHPFCFVLDCCGCASPRKRRGTGRTAALATSPSRPSRKGTSQAATLPAHWRQSITIATADDAPVGACGPRGDSGHQFDLLINALIAGILLGGFYAAVTLGISISFGILDIVNIAHPAFIILGSYIAYIVNTQLGIDPILVSIVMLPVFYALGAGGLSGLLRVVREARAGGADAGSRSSSACCSSPRCMLILVFGVDYRYVEASYIGPTLAHRLDRFAAAHAGAVRRRAR